MQYALKHLFDYNICRVAGFDLFIYALQRRNYILRKRYLQVLIGAAAYLLACADDRCAHAALGRKLGHRKIDDLLRMLDYIVAHKKLRLAEIFAH